MKGNKGREQKENEKRLKEIEGMAKGKKKWVQKKRRGGKRERNKGKNVGRSSSKY